MPTIADDIRFDNKHNFPRQGEVLHLDRSAMTETKRERLLRETALSWKRAIRRWQQAGEIVLLEETACVLTDAVFTWAGIPLKQAKVRRRARDLMRMVEGAGSVGPRLWQASFARARTQLWIAYLVHKVRRGKLQVQRDCPLYMMAKHRDADGRELDLEMVARGLVDDALLPTVAVAWDVVSAASALHEHPNAADEIARDWNRGGEWPKASNVTLALHYLTRCCVYEVVPGQDLSIDLTRVPTQPKSGLIIRSVQETAALQRPAPRVTTSSTARSADDGAKSLMHR